MNYTYEVTNLVRDASDIVITATFTITASDGVDSFKHTYTTGFANNPVTPLAFTEITESKVIDWIKRDAGEESAFESSAAAELEAHKLRKAQGEQKNGVGWAAKGEKK